MADGNVARLCELWVKGVSLDWRKLYGERQSAMFALPKYPFADEAYWIVPGADPARAARLLEPMVALLAAVMYANFCRDIEPDERIYHASDALRMLRQAATQDARLWPG